MKDLTIDITTDVAEVVFDSIVDQGLLADLPVVGWAVKVARASNTISDKILLKKIEAFLYNFKDSSEAEKQIMRSRLENEEGRERIGEKLMFVLERADDLTKAALLGRCFRKYLEKAFSKDELLRFWHAVDKCFLDDLARLQDYMSETTKASVVAWRLLAAGLVESTGVDMGTTTWGKSGEMRFVLNSVGLLFARHVMGEQC